MLINGYFVEGSQVAGLESVRIERCVEIDRSAVKRYVEVERIGRSVSKIGVKKCVESVSKGVKNSRTPQKS